jgi:hypothetical protein
MICAIFSGDIVQSTRLAAPVLDAVMTVIQETLQSHLQHDVRFTRNRGDGWQAMLHDPLNALEATVALVAALRQRDVETRIAIGIGIVEQLGTRDLSDARGPALTASGHALDATGRGQRLTIAGDGIGGLDRAIVTLLDERTSRWTREQAEAVGHMLAPRQTTAREVAKTLGVTPQAMSDRLSGAGYPAIKAAVAWWREAKQG